MFKVIGVVVVSLVAIVAWNVNVVRNYEKTMLDIIEKRGHYELLWSEDKVVLKAE